MDGPLLVGFLWDRCSENSKKEWNIAQNLGKSLVKCLERSSFLVQSQAFILQVYKKYNSSFYKQIA